MNPFRTWGGQDGRTLFVVVIVVPIDFSTTTTTTIRDWKDLPLPISLASGPVFPFDPGGMKPHPFLTALVLTLATIPVLRAADVWTPEPGFTSLYNGADLTGWGYRDKEGKVVETFDVKASASDERYTAKGESLTVNPFTEGKGPKLRQLYTTREFPKDFILKLEFRAAVDADSGIFLRKPQLQCRDYLVAGPYKELKQYKPQDWNVIEVVVKDGKAHCTCNGEVLVDALQLPETGPIGLEADRGTMEYRRIQVKEL